MLLDPLPDGVTSVTNVVLYREPDRSDSPTAVPADHQTDGTWTIDTLPSSVTPGRTYPTVNAMKGSTIYLYPIDHLDLPEDPTLLFSPEELADAIGMALPLTDKYRRIFTNSIRASQNKVRAYLGRPLFPTTYVQAHCWPYGQGWDLTIQGDDPVTSVVSSVAETDTSNQPTGYFTVTFIAGLDVKHDRALGPIMDFVLTDAASSTSVVNVWREATGTKGSIKSLSAEGQSVSYDPAFPLGAPPANSRASGQDMTHVPGALVTLDALDYWRIAGRRVHQGASRYGADDGAW